MSDMETYVIGIFVVLLIGLSCFTEYNKTPVTESVETRYGVITEYVPEHDETVFTATKFALSETVTIPSQCTVTLDGGIETVINGQVADEIQSVGAPMQFEIKLTSYRVGKSCDVLRVISDDGGILYVIGED